MYWALHELKLDCVEAAIRRFAPFAARMAHRAG
jgi:hypothetical protein